MSEQPVVSVVMGSDSDWPVMQAAVDALREFGVPWEADVVSAHRMPAGIPVATVSVGGARNAGLLAVRILATSDAALADRVAALQADLRATAQAKGAALRAKLRPDAADADL